MSKSRLAKEFLEYITVNKKLWLMPILIVLGLIVLAVIVSQAPALAPFIYTLF